MNKQQLASKIWESANRMRSKIEANEYKDYILGFMFYKFMSDKEVKFLKDNDFTEEDMICLVEEDEETRQFVQNGIGYFIAYKDLFSTWIAMGNAFDVANVTDALSAFKRLIHPSHKKLFDRIFNTLETGLSKLGDTTGARTKAISGLIDLIKDIPMDGKQDYDVLGFIYEYLINMFAANAGKKAGEFYTPHEVSLLMSEIVAAHLHDRQSVEIYDPTSGSGSLLINIGRSVSKYIPDQHKIKYYAQELKENTYNLTRMNLIMRNILVDNIVTRNGDTLEEDWPYFEEDDPVRTYNPLYVDAVVSNPPYSQQWDPANKENDPRYKDFGLAPKSKADYAFLLHDLYHIRPDGIMTIVLPHGVLFRGGEEGEIRKNLIERNHIDAVIGLPANVFFGTGIPTIIMVLKQKRSNTDVLIVDASKGFIKAGKNNKLQASHIKKIVDAVVNRENIDKFSRKVSQQEIRDNDYNLNIPRYVDSSDEAESWDIYATMFGGIPLAELETYNDYWKAFPGLKESLFIGNGSPYVALGVENINQAITRHASVIKFIEGYRNAFCDFTNYVKKELIDHINSVDTSKAEGVFSDDIFNRLRTVPLVDKYEAYQVLDDQWRDISVDLEIIQTEGFAATKLVDPNMVIKKKDGKNEEVQEGWKGHVLPFLLVQQSFFADKLESIAHKEERLVEIGSEYTEIIDSLSEEEKDSSILNDSNDKFVAAEVHKELNRIYADVETDEIRGINGYLQLLNEKARKPVKEAYIHEHAEVGWYNIESNKDGTYGKTKMNSYLDQLRSSYTFVEDTYEAKMAQVNRLMSSEKTLNAQVKEEKEVLHQMTKDKIENLGEAEVLKLLETKWIVPLMEGIDQIPKKILRSFSDDIQKLADKYTVTYTDIEQQITTTEQDMAEMMDDLTGNEFDMKGLREFKTLLKGE